MKRFECNHHQQHVKLVELLIVSGILQRFLDLPLLVPRADQPVCVVKLPDVLGAKVQIVPGLRSQLGMSAGRGATRTGRGGGHLQYTPEPGHLDRRHPAPVVILVASPGPVLRVAAQPLHKPAHHIASHRLALVIAPYGGDEATVKWVVCLVIRAGLISLPIGGRVQDVGDVRVMVLARLEDSLHIVGEVRAVRRRCRIFQPHVLQPANRVDHDH